MASQRNHFIVLLLHLLCLTALMSTTAWAQPDPQNSAITKIGFLGDVEGHWDIMDQFIKAGEPLFYQDGQVKLRPNQAFVFLGDASDKGDSSRKVVATLTALKKAYPDRVTLLLGNRDINKLRIPHELHDPNYLNGKYGPYYSDWLAGRSDSQANRLKFIMERTMGAAKGFEFRRMELASELTAHLSSITDDMVVESYLQELKPNGKFIEFLRLGQLAHIHNEALIVHGGITKENLGLIPGHDNTLAGAGKETARAELQAWVHGLNDWKNQMLDAWKIQTGQALGHPPTAWVELIKYQQPNLGSPTNIYSVVYARFSDDTGNPRMLPSEQTELLKLAGIDKIFVGHTPYGEIPVLLHENNFQIALMDNSFQTGKYQTKQNLLLVGHHLSAKYIDSAGAELTIDNRDPHIGQWLENVRIVAKTASGEYLGFSVGDHFSVNYEQKSEAQLIQYKNKMLSRCLFKKLQVEL